MEIKNEDPAKVSRTEIRKQKLAEYLAAKGRLKPPNPKPYLKNSAPPGAVQKSHTVGLRAQGQPGYSNPGARVLGNSGSLKVLGIELNSGQRPKALTI